MSKGDNLFGIKTIYKGIEFKSKLESKFALFLDALNIKWKYEPRAFFLHDEEGKCFKYIPDFYCYEIHTWIEVKGNIKEHNKKISKNFIKNNFTTGSLILISNELVYWFGQTNYYPEIEQDSNIYIGRCNHCNKYYFCSVLGDWSCKYCGIHDGDHNILYSLQSGFYENDKIDFYDSNSIKEGLKRYGTSI